MLLFLAVTDEKTSSNVRIVIDENLFPQIAEGNRDSFVRLYELTKDLVYLQAHGAPGRLDRHDRAQRLPHAASRAAAHSLGSSG